MALMQYALYNMLWLRENGKTPSSRSPCCVLFAAVFATCQQNCTSLSHYSHVPQRLVPNLPTTPFLSCHFTISIYLSLLPFSSSLVFMSILNAFHKHLFMLFSLSMCLQFLQRNRIECGFRLFAVLNRWVKYIIYKLGLYLSRASSPGEGYAFECAVFVKSCLSSSFYRSVCLQLLCWSLFCFAVFSVFVWFLLVFLVPVLLCLCWHFWSSQKHFTVVMCDLGFDNVLLGTLSMRTVFAFTDGRQGGSSWLRHG